MRFKTLLTVPALLGLSLTYGQTGFEWAIKIGSTGAENANDIAVDNADNVIVGGGFTGNANFNGTADNMISNGGQDAFVAKFDNTGDLLWDIPFGGLGTSTNETVNAVAVDNANNVYVTGVYYGTIDVDPQPTVSYLISNGQSDVFVIKYDANGSLVWAKSMGGSQWEAANEVVVDGSGNVYVTGLFYGTGDYDPGAGTTNLVSNGNYDVFVTKLDSNGDLVWANSFGSSADDYGNSIAVDASGNVIVGGYFQGTVDFDPGTGTDNLSSAGVKDMFVAKYDAAGNHVWASRFGGSGDDNCKFVTTDASGNIYHCGNFATTADMDPGTGTANYTSNGSTDAYVQKLDANGQVVWTQVYGGSQDDHANELALAGNGEVHVTGAFKSTVDFDPAGAGNSLSTFGQNDSYFHSLDGSTGNVNWTRQFGGSQWEAGNGIAHNSSDEIYATGIFFGTSDFDHTTNTTSLTSFGDFDAYVVKHGQCSTTSSTTTLTNCGPYAWTDGNTYSSTGVYTQTLTNAAGCDSIATLDLTIAPSNSTSVVPPATCGSYTWTSGNGQTYTASGSYTMNLTNIHGCDSTVTLHLTILEETSGSTTVTACEEYTWSDGVTYTATGTYTQMLTNAAGCDSLATLNLFVEDDIDTSVTVNGNTISANFSTADSYQWIDCNTGDPIVGEVSSSYTPAVVGTYAVTFFYNGCTDISSCITITGASIDEQLAKQVSIYPIPVKSVLNVSTTLNVVGMEIIDVTGRKMMNCNTQVIDVTGLSQGTYFIRLTTEENQVVLKKFMKH
jgi:hypothetical protein